ncbi:energy-coupling factor transporter transmembrane component T family protein [Corynebacterium cystitidis]|uniref:energy-coupling factor transporter transmembrane component T family protein n=1 Tax=Corynebacterium cystitidis TaxID=35757 RepID=UPI00211E48F8|nr:energy-coupling factor transporter transmembrane protein EcfT [Corynebacterium cystitidis]
MITAMPMGVYVSGDTVLHRLPAWSKMLVLIVFVIFTTIFANTVSQACYALAIVALGYLVARIPWRTAAGQTLPVLPLLLFLGAFQVWQHSWSHGIALVISLFACVAAASLLTLTTTIAELMESLERALRPLDKFGLPVDTISLSLSLTIRLIPLMLDTVNEVMQARQARGASMSLPAFGAPIMIRSIRRARALGEALMARGVVD